MKKYLKLIPIMLYPYAYIIAIMFIYFVEEKHPKWGETPIFEYTNYAIAILYQIVCLVVAIVFIVQCAKGKWTAKQATKANLLIKCIHIPAYILHFILGLMGLIMSVWGLPILAFAIVVDLLTIFISGLCAIGSMIGMKKDKVTPTAVSVLLSIGSFLYCIDVIIAFVCFILCAENEKAKRRAIQNQQVIQ